MEGKKFIRSIQLQNILSYGPATPALELEPLNVFIGPNGSGKSNLIEALQVLGAAPRDIQVPIRQGGGVSEWIWKGGGLRSDASILVGTNNDFAKSPISHFCNFSGASGRFELLSEKIETADPTEELIYYQFGGGNAMIRYRGSNAARPSDSETQSLARDAVSPDQSILSQRREPVAYPEITYLAQQYERMRFYREWDLRALRLPQKTDLPGNWLLEDGSNLGLVLNDLDNKPGLKARLLALLRAFYPNVTDYKTVIQGGTVQIFFHEEGLKQPVPASRLSDGTLRFLCLVVILCHPEPPPVVCIEEPELGLHPDVIPQIAEMLVDAASRTQLFVTTHSDALIDALSDYPETIVVCEKDEQGTSLRRLDPEAMKEWLNKYRLGELWQMGELGGNP